MKRFKGHDAGAQLAVLVVAGLVMLGAWLMPATSPGPARAYAQTEAPAPAVPEATPDPITLPGPEGPPITCARLRAMGAGPLWLETFGCWSPACLREQRAKVERRMYRAARKAVKP